MVCTAKNTITDEGFPNNMGPDQEFMMDWFHRYYSSFNPLPPSQLDKREFGFMFFDHDFVQRHIGFNSTYDLQKYLMFQVPSHVYYSSAYYQFPGANTMGEKSWTGADLIFDLDADHIKGAEDLSYADMLARIKVELLRLVDDFLIGDMGFNAEELQIVFSGGRGYHIHIEDPRLTQLKNHERREIVDYIAGTDLDFGWAFPERTVNARTIKGHTQVSRVRLVPPDISGGWRKRMRTGVAWLIEEMRSRDKDDLKKRLPALSTAQDMIIDGMLRDLYSKKGEYDGGELILSKDVMECFTDHRHEELFLMLLEKEVKPRFISEIDEPVTSDIKRLIRLPGSLHGKTGLAVTPIKRDELDDFDPLRDAVPEIYI